MKATIAIASLLLIATIARASDLELWYKQPAQKWEEALPVGSGRLGAMVFGGTSEERIQFNEDTLWTGKPHNYVRAGAREHLADLRKAAFANLSEDDPAAGWREFERVPNQVGKHLKRALAIRDDGRQRL